MLVRLKKRGEFPVHSANRYGISGNSGIVSFFRGCCVEVSEPFYHENFTCGGLVYFVRDSRLLALIGYIEGVNPAICEHSLIDDLDAYESDSADEQAEIGDLATVAIPQTVKAR